MKRSSLILFFVSLLIFFSGCKAQTKQPGQKQVTDKNEKQGPVGGGCDGCEIMYVGMPATIHAIDTSAGWNEKGQKLLITGTIFKPDGRTAASNIILYYWQTDNDGYYAPTEGMEKEAKRHGHIRGWVRTGEDGKYSIYTIRPAAYPKEVFPAHIHLLIKEPELKNEYYTEDITFDDDKLLIPHLKKYPPKNRGGSGVVRILINGDVQIAKHDIKLGLNIPDYPIKSIEN